MSSTEKVRTPDWFPRLLDRHDSSDREHLGVGLVTYGSLLHRDEIEILFSSCERRVDRVQVKGFRRCFNKSLADHLRDSDGDRRGVLNLVRSAQNEFNGLLIHPISRSALKKYAFREREYGLTQLSHGQVDPYESPPGTPVSPEYLYTCLLEDTGELEPGLEPVPKYLELCLEGARQWGESFHEDFLRTTHVGQQSLKSYLRERSP